MKVLQQKGVRKAKRFGVKIPMNLAERIAELDDQVKLAGYQVDWSAPAAKALAELADAVEKDLSEIPANDQ